MWVNKVMILKLEHVTVKVAFYFEEEKNVKMYSVVVIRGQYELSNDVNSTNGSQTQRLLGHQASSEHARSATLARTDCAVKTSRKSPQFDRLPSVVWQSTSLSGRTILTCAGTGRSVSRSVDRSAMWSPAACCCSRGYRHYVIMHSDSLWSHLFRFLRRHAQPFDINI